MKAKVEYWNPKNERVHAGAYFTHMDITPVITGVQTWEGTKEEIFNRFYKENKSLAYCNNSFLKFEEDVIQEAYKSWYDKLDESTKFHMHYGNGVVD